MKLGVKRLKRKLWKTEMESGRVISADAIEQYYDGRSDKFVGDYVEKNRRVAQQKIFAAAVIPCVAERVLVIGC